MRCRGQVLAASCLQCGYAEYEVLFPIAELAMELTARDEGREAGKNGRGGRLKGRPSRNGVSL